MFAPSDLARRFATWRERARFRAALARLVEDPHLAADVGFDVPSIRAERARLPWEPVRLRRGPGLRQAVVDAPASSGFGGIGLNPAAARRI
ncbi:hypothetical protein [Oharaeibacter diazotrophicus]|uniref:DUF1127 domain-containing protein n=1 Tax=Oharaeibacter diazotrophicus TaxID=1920512 RepID=A0A4V3CVI7_9HYPH|nr:hypothetical protein [Oharaeibacter diazotrophicus]TDP82628.1 hypothetical protein EDD54_3897 [Oharaeibacter diazotrophicus]BBE72608.1 hypothetical protein OHA_1_02206 [Pleomorphomonas sp. SM30]GLS76642.1 hypothetical protein GCM10007904_19790 [Oharaeibacter diazotrophicus]